MERTPYDGKPYYYKRCNCGFDEFMACELPDCKLETELQAKKRAAAQTASRKSPRSLERRGR